MKTFRSDHTIHSPAVSLTAAVIVSLAMMASAAADVTQVRGMGLFLSEPQPLLENEPEAVYGKLKAASRELCGSDNLYIAGGVERSQDVKACYEGTLTAAVQRLDDPEVTDLHYR